MFSLFNRKNKKASLELSINAIVVVVLAITLLGLGLGFIRGMFGRVGGMTTEVQEQVREQITAQLRTTGEKISFPRTVDIGRGEMKVLTVGVQNTGSQTVYFGFDLSLDPTNSDHLKGTPPQFLNISDAYNPRYSSNPCAYSLGPSEADAYGININAPKTAGTDMMTVKVILGNKNNMGTCDPAGGDGGVYATKTTFVTVG